MVRRTCGKPESVYTKRLSYTLSRLLEDVDKLRTATGELPGQRGRPVCMKQLKRVAYNRVRGTRPPQVDHPYLSGALPYAWITVDLLLLLPDGRRHSMNKGSISGRPGRQPGLSYSEGLLCQRLLTKGTPRYLILLRFSGVYPVGVLQTVLKRAFILWATLTRSMWCDRDCD